MADSDSTSCDTKKNRDQRRFAAPPSIRGRRGHSVFDEIPGLGDWIDTEFRKKPRPTFREIEESLRESSFWPELERQGYRPGKSTIHDYYSIWQKREVVRSTTAPNAEPGTLEIERGITTLINRALARDITKEVVASGGLLTPRALELADMHRKHQASSARVEAERRKSGEIERLASERAYRQARAEMTAVLSAHPEALDIVIAALDQAEANAKAAAAAAEAEKTNEKDPSSNRGRGRRRRAEVQINPPTTKDEAPAA